jgi:5-methylcytosine-specific restriction endonuclease McrA
MAEGICERDGCERAVCCKGLCKSHYTLYRRNHPDRPRCAVGGCDQPRYGKGLCIAHYQAGPGRESHRRANREYARRNSAEMAVKYRAWFAANPEKRRAARSRWMREWRATNPEAARAAMRQWIDNNPERWAQLRRAAWHTRRARKATTQLEPIDLTLVLAVHGMTCHICKDAIESMADLHFDHVIPLARGGTHTYDNLKPAHARCNIRKGARAPT